MRLTITFDENASDALASIKKASGMSAVADVVRLALTVLRALMEADRRGFKIVLRQPDSEREYSYSLSRPTEIVVISKSKPRKPEAVIALASG